VVESGIAAYVGAKLPAVDGYLGIKNAAAQAAFNAAAGSVASQTVAIALGDQKGFNWAQVAASAAIAPIAQAVGGAVGGKLGQGLGGSAAAQTFGRAVGALASGELSGVAIAEFSGGTVNQLLIVADAFGNAIGNSQVEEVAGPPSAPQATTPANEVDGSNLNTFNAAGYTNTALKYLTLENLTDSVTNNPAPSAGVNISIAPGGSVLGGISSAGIGSDQSAAAYGYLFRTGQLTADDLNSTGTPIVYAGDSFQVDPGQFTAADTKLGGLLIANESNNRAILAAQAQYDQLQELDTDSLPQRIPLPDASAPVAAPEAGQTTGFAARNAVLESERVDTAAFIDQMRNGTVIADLGANALTLLTNAGSSLLKTGNFIYSLATDSSFDHQVGQGLSYIVNHPSAVYNAAIDRTSAFFDLDIADKATFLGQAGADFLTSLGATEGFSLTAKGLGTVGRYALENFGTGPLPGSLSAQVGAIGDLGAAGRTLNPSTGDVYSPDFVGPVQWKYFYRGDATARTEFMSTMAQERGVQATTEFLNNQPAGSLSDIYAEHGVSSNGLPTIGVSDDQAVAEYFARGPYQDQDGFVTTFRLSPEDATTFANPNFENPYSFFENNPAIGSPEREYLFHVQIDPKFVFKQTQVRPQ